MSSDGGRKAGGAQRVRSAPSRQGMPRRSTGSRRSARTSTYWRLAAAATCCAIWLFAAPGGPHTMQGWRARRSTYRASARHTSTRVSAPESGGTAFHGCSSSSPRTASPCSRKAYSMDSNGSPVSPRRSSCAKTSPMRAFVPRRRPFQSSSTSADAGLDARAAREIDNVLDVPQRPEDEDVLRPVTPRGFRNRGAPSHDPALYGRATRPRQRHDEDPGAQVLTDTRVEDLGPLAEVDLGRLAGVELQHGGDMRVSGLEACEEAANRGVRAGEAVAAYQGGVDGGALDALTPPTRHPLAMRFRQRGDRGLCTDRTQGHGKLGVIGQRRGDVEPACRLGGAAKLRRLAPTQ